MPFAVLEAATEAYAAGEEPVAWLLVASLALAAVALPVAARSGRPPWLGAGALVFDTAFLSAWAVLYAAEPGTPARELLVLAAVEGGLRYGPWGSLWAVTALPALVLFEARLSNAVDGPFDVGHAVFPAGLYGLVGLVVGALSEERRRAGSPAPPSEPPPSA